MVIEPAFGTFGSVGRCQVLLENEISISIKLVSRRKHEVLSNFLVDGCVDCGLQKTQWTNTSRWHGSPNHHWLWKLHTGLQATWILCLSTLPPDSGTLFPNQQRRLHRALPLLDLFILVRQSIRLLYIRNYDLHSREQSSFSVLLNLHHQWGKDTNVSATKPSSVYHTRHHTLRKAW